MMASGFSPPAFNPYGREPEESLPTQFASVNMDDGCFNENTGLLCEPTPSASEATPSLNGFGWEQLWLADQQSLAGAVAVPVQQEVPPGQPNTVSHAPRYDCNANLFSYSNWLNQIASPATEPESPTTSLASHGWPQVRTAERSYRRRNPHSDQHSPPQFTKLDPAPMGRVVTRPRRDSGQTESHQDNNNEGDNGDKKHDDDKTSSQNGNTKEKKTAPTALSPKHDDEQFRRIQHRNRIASNKFRNKKREDSIILQARVQEMEQLNHKLASSKADYIQQIQYCKMLLLQHAECHCVLIQNYIGMEAKRYIRDIQDDPSQQFICPT
ncbi:hypothetical protein B0J13DRAFT_137317 [Dactylonectria estremocensis]|uniref:BZIP domain-containing protein n=1 Tax=Dactylonectria estremocensis TaxID=1079267 RepID=A0A9P9ISF9_9HYPO|nr:hypothetical protein B0J13DRAFT_137317 [Dactylonectria estremocensis]